MITGFDLASRGAIDNVNKIVDTVLVSNQRRYHDDGIALFLIKNRLLLNTAIGLANRSVKFHDIDHEKISDTKKFAHICFWMLRLQPVSYTTDISITNSIKAKIPNFTSLISSDPSRRILEVEPVHHMPVNAEASFFTFILLCMSSEDDGSKFSNKLIDFRKDSYCEQVINSLRYHNYSSRSMAMFLESLYRERFK